jgi:general secretion pathway protein H
VGSGRSRIGSRSGLPLDLGPLTSDLGRPLSAGYTLIELAAVIGIVLIISVAAFAAIQSVRKADISTSAGRMAASIRYLYDLAVLNNRPYRLVVDVAGGAYWGEAVDTGQGACGAALLPSEDERKYGPAGRAMTIGSGQARPGAAEAGEGGEEAPKPAAGGGLGKDNLLKRTTLPKGIAFGGVMTTHQDETTEEGRGEVYFFPSGYVERAFIYLKQDEDVYTIVTLPLRGTGVVRHEEVDPRELLD